MKLDFKILFIKKMMNVFKQLETKEIHNLLGPRGSVILENVFPNECPENRTIENIIVTTARVSYNLEDVCKSIPEDKRLLKYLYENKHMSPFEMIVFRFKIEMPISAKRQLDRHRTASQNEKSLRYVEDKEDLCYYPIDFPEGIRYQSALNHQGSCNVPPELKDEFNLLFQKQKDLIGQCHELYHEMISKGVAKECARGHLPVNTFTHFYWQINLRNLLHFLNLRCHSSAQMEIRIYANAMRKLIEPLVPQCIELLTREENSITIYEEEFPIFRGEKTIDEIKLARGRKDQLGKDLVRMGI